MNVKENSFTLVTLDGHLEAGRIEFRLTFRDKKFRFEIESSARSKDKLVNLLYDVVPVCRVAQAEMWQEFCRSFAETAAGKDSPFSPVETFTEKKEDDGSWKRL